MTALGFQTRIDRLNTRELIILLAEHLGVDLEVLAVAATSGFGDDLYAVDHDQRELMDDIDTAAAWITAGGPVDPLEARRERTVRLLAARRLRESGCAR